ncbi:rhomboid family intramembrane serine protease [Carnobacteriaceae bacterium zg-ZUI252]|nr:rhomboid family intramembrane serine protease [Carnobacteriaceae bacterium zg-ZUI252]MBS4770044.1 rhomboid family intramembrane serine protease [Carnobacteriaceae bacterium zg-ZUI240]QTU83266.1 rhomboid family intramembrane serine protease [Carnobacteriaceae bacterium zg-C25]
MKQYLKAYPATMTLIAVNLLLFVSTTVQGGNSQALIKLGGMYPLRIAVFNEYWRLITAGFLHSGVTHLMTNMFSLFIVGTILEPIFKKEKFIGIYMVSSIFSISFSYAFGAANRVSVGASGAIFGYFITVVLLTKLAPYHRGVRALSQQFLATVLLNVALSFLPGIDWLGHLGGALGGVLAFYMFGYYTTNRQKQMLLMSIFLIAVVVLNVIGTKSVYSLF